MAFKLLDRARMSVSGAPGTGSITLASAVVGYQSFTQAGISNGDSFPYSITDGNNWEYGIATYASAGNVLTRATSKTSAQSASPLSLTSRAVISSCLRAEDISQATTFASLTDVSVTTGAGVDGYVAYWNNTDGKFELKQVTYASLPDQPTVPTNSSLSLHLLGDTNMSPGPFVDGYLVKWDNASSRFILAPPNFGQQSTISGFFAGLLNSSETLLQFIAYKNITLPASGVASRAYAGVAPTVTQVLNVVINGTTVGTVTFTAGSQTGAYSVTTDNPLLAGQTLQVIAPAAPDTTLADVSISIVFNAP